MRCVRRTLLGVAILALSLGTVSEGTGRPNVLLIISDDQTYRDFGFMGNADVHTPNLDRLASKSLRFPNGYVPTSVCSPSLATLLTGLYPHQHQLHFNHPPPGNSGFNKMASREEYERVRSRSFSRIRELPTLPRELAKVGYRSLQTGKFWEGRFANAGFTDGMTVFEPVPGQTFGGNRKLASGELAAHGNGDFGLKIGRETMAPIDAFIDKAEKDDVPWLVWYAPYLPHEPHDSPKRFFDLYADKAGVPKHAIPYYASICQFDETVGHLLDGLERRGLMGETLIVFVVDNGWTPKADGTGKHTKESKRSPFEDGLRTPVLFCHEGDIEPGEREVLVSSVSIVPTILNACGVKTGSMELPGRDLLASKLDAIPIFGGIYPGDATSLGHPERDIAYRWVREGDLKLITVHSHDGEEPWGRYLNEDALFDLRSDPSEKQNLINEKTFARDVGRLRDALDAWWTP